MVTCYNLLVEILIFFCIQMVNNSYSAAADEVKASNRRMWSRINKLYLNTNSQESLFIKRFFYIMFVAVFKNCLTIKILETGP